jgi:hypothetical protein
VPVRTHPRTTSLSQAVMEEVLIPACGMQL